MANRTLDHPCNIYSNKQWMEGWAQMLVPGTYERGIFGDLILPGIACAIRKFILIFNTDLNTPHDPIYVVDPTSFNITPDTEIPVVLSYNMSHYESMEPSTEVDVQLSKGLVKEYIEGRYRYSKQDLPYLLSNQPEREADKFNNNEQRNIIMNIKKASAVNMRGKSNHLSSVDNNDEKLESNGHIRGNQLEYKKLKLIKKEREEKQEEELVGNNDQNIFEDKE